MELLESYFEHKKLFQIRPKLSLLRKSRDVDYYMFDIYGINYVVILKRYVNRLYKHSNDLLATIKDLILACPNHSFFSQTILVHFEQYLTGEYLFLYKITSEYRTLTNLSESKLKTSYHAQIFILYDYLQANNYYMYYTAMDAFFLFDTTLGIIDFDNIQKYPTIIHPIQTSVYVPHKSKVKTTYQALPPTNDAKNLLEYYNEQYRINFFKHICMIMSQLQKVNRCGDVCIVSFIRETPIHKKICLQNKWNLNTLQISTQLIKNNLF